MPFRCIRPRCLPNCWDCNSAIPEEEWQQYQRTGWPPGMLQDDDRKLSKALANKVDSRMHAREAAAAIEGKEKTE